jgi:hypothetical protein
MSTTAKTAIPSLESVSPRFVEAVRKLARVEAHLASLDQRIAATRSALSEMLNNGDAAARALLDADDMGAAGTGGQAALIDEVNRLAGDRRTAMRALDLARLETRAARGEASGEVCKGLLPGYRAKVDRLARALLAAYAAHRDLEALTDDLDAAEIGWAGCLPPMQIPYFRDFARDGQFPLWLIEAREHGLTDVDLPADWVRAWGMRPQGAPAVRVAVKRR